jgi:ABC-type glycerol-3-phosphate transport system substrate-binding protein
MILAPSWRAFDIAEINPSLRFKIAPIPQLPGNTVNWASYWVEGVSSKSKYPAQAMEFIKFLTSKEGATLLYSEEAKARKLFGEPYARMELASTLTNDPYAGAYVVQGKDARAFPLASRTFDNGLNDKLIVYLENALNALKTGSSPTTELETMKTGFQQVFTTYRLTTNTTSAQQQP